MSYALRLEIESGLTAAELQAAALEVGAKPSDEGLSSELARFEDSGLRLHVLPDPQSRVLTEGIASMPDWKVGLVADLTYDLRNNDACNRDVVRLLRHLQRFSTSRFVLSFQYETPLAVRDASQLTIFPDCGLPIQ